MKIPTKLGTFSITADDKKITMTSKASITPEALAAFNARLQEFLDESSKEEVEEKVEKGNKEVTWSKQDLWEYTVAQDDDEDYSESGYICCIRDKKAYIGRYSHCSCYGTWTSLTNHNTGQPTWSWIGTIPELKKLVKGKKDPCLPIRDADPSDYDYNHLMNLYKDLTEYFAKEKNDRFTS